MTGQRRVFTLLGLAGLGVALLAWGIGVKSTNDLVGLVGACISAAVGVLSLVEAARRGPGRDASRAGDPVAGDAAGRIGGPATDGRRAGPGSDDGRSGGRVDGPESGGEGTGRTGSPGAPSGPARRRPSRRLLAAGIAVLLLVVAGTTLAHAITDRRSDADATSPSATSPGATTPAATTPAATTSASADPSTTGEPDPPTSAAPTPGPTGPDWVPPPDAPRWTLRGEDAVSFVPALRLDRGTGAGTLIFQARLKQLAWYHWTDDPKDLSYAGCRNPRASRPDSINLNLVRKTPVTYCQPDPGDPTVVNYLQILHNRFRATPPSVELRVWSVSG
ncbi:hypothetical protein ACFT9M_05080 [Micromonospora purpureochromogenes]|uniref:hypothetical protein n=1 Tax=Micromonospora purpureochromogenes TaxID=47872 RepID=UPI003631DDCC